MADRDPILRRALLAWVQEHHIQRYNDQTVVSHTEAVEELMDIVKVSLADPV